MKLEDLLPGKKGCMGTDVTKKDKTDKTELKNEEDSGKKVPENELDDVCVFLGGKVRVHNKKVPEKMKRIMREELRIRSRKYDQLRSKGEDVSHLSPYIEFYEEDKTFVYVPKGYIRRMNQLFRANRMSVRIVQDTEINTLPEVPHPWNKKADDHVYEVVNYTLYNRRYGVIEGYPGTGKRLISLMYICEKRLKGLILVKRIALLWIWKSMIEAYMDGCTIGIVGAGQETWGDITIAVDRSLYKRKGDPRILEYGILVVDEVHLANMKIFTKLVHGMPFWAVFGLSEGKHVYGLQKVVDAVVGPVLCRVPKEKSKYYGAGGEERRLVIRETEWEWEYRDDYEDMVTELSRDEKRNRGLVTDILEAEATGGKCLVVGSRVEHLEYLLNRFREQGVAGRLVDWRVRNKEALFKEFDAGKYNILCITFPGLPDIDVNRADRLFFVTPVKFGGHIAGILTRLFGSRKMVVVYDYLDSVEVLKGQFKSRMKIYEKLGMKIV